MLNKRGQAFLISAVLLISILVAFLTIMNYSKKTTFSKLDYLSEQIQIESEKVMDYDLAQDKNRLEYFEINISNNLDKDTRIYFITKNSTNEWNLHNYTGGFINNFDLINLENENVTATIDNSNYTFPYFTKGKPFYYIMIKEYKGEKYVYTN